MMHKCKDHIMEMDDAIRKIAALEEDILSLETAVKEKLKEKKLVTEWRQYQKVIECQLEDSGEKEDLESLKNQINLLSRLTDVKIDRTDVEIIQQDRLQLSKKVRIEGTCLGCNFLVDVNITDFMDNNAKVTSIINRLQIELNSVNRKDLYKHIKTLEVERDVQGFFFLLQSYMKWTQLRDTTFQHFCSSYPDIVSQKNQHCLQIQHVEKPCVFKIDWVCRISDNHMCYQEINLSVKTNFTSQVSNKDDVLTSAPDKFQLMLKELGIEKSINCIVTLCSEG